MRILKYRVLLTNPIKQWIGIQISIIHADNS